MVSLINLTNDREFFNHYKRTLKLLQECDNTYYVTKKDKKDLAEGAPMERIHMQYLILKDPELYYLIHNTDGAKVWIDLIEYTFGQVKNSTEHIVRIHNQILQFQHSKEESVFILFVGAVNHWVAFIAHKPRWDKVSSKN